MTVRWTDTAVAHLEALHAYISQDSPHFARVTIDRLTSRSEQIAQFPLSGRAVPEFEKPDIREVVEKPYRMIYRTTKDRIEILAAVHSPQALPPSI